MTDFQAKVNALMALLDTNEIPADANRKTVHDFAKSRGMMAGNLVIQEVVKRRKAPGSPELSQEFTPPPGPLNSPPEFIPSEEPPKLPDLSTDHLNSGSRIQQNSPRIGTPEFLGSSINTAQENSPPQTDDDCSICGASIHWQRLANGKTECARCEAAS